MQWNSAIRQVHRWLSIVFTIAVIANFAVLTQHQPPVWLGILALIPLFLLLFSGLYLFALPYFARRGGARG